MITVQELHEKFEYEYGHLYYRHNGKQAGGNNNGYRVIMVNGEREYEHRLVWRMFKGDLYSYENVTHINGVRDDNRIENLSIVRK